MLIQNSDSIKTLLQKASKALEDISDSATLDAELLLAYCIDKNRTYLHTWPENTISDKQLECFQSFIKKRSTDYPVAYMLGVKDFWSLELIVSEDVLIPRPETELLVETALEKIKDIHNPKILDLGTGSGAIALAIASERADAKIIASDFSEKALDVAKTNTEKQKLSSNIQFIQSNWYENIDDNDFDLIVSNPPYIDPKDVHLKSTIRHEPVTALVAENKGLKDLEIIIENAFKHLKNNGWLLVEHGFDQGAQVNQLFNQHTFTRTNTLIDIRNNPRVSLGLFKKSKTSTRKGI